ncbi:hypothetical protein [Actinomyces naeslundii]|nr:hypothetical protein [Actinomyces naeslundii]
MSSRRIDCGSAHVCWMDTEMLAHRRTPMDPDRALPQVGYCMRPGVH